MKPLHLLMTGAAMAGLLIFAAAEAGAQQRALGGPRIMLPSHANHFSWEGRHGGFHGNGGGFGALRHAQDGRVFIIEREVPVIVEREVVREIPAPEKEAHSSAPLSPGQRPRFVIGSSYASLPGGCMKLIEEGASYYFCGGGEWYRQVGKQYRAVARKL
jgi:hypothetical protein